MFVITIKQSHMIFQKLLILSIMDALDRVWSENGITPSKKTRQSILRAAEKISDDVQEDFITANKSDALSKEKWESTFLSTSRRPLQPSDTPQLADPDLA